MLRWPRPAEIGPGEEGRGPTRSVGTSVILVNGAVAAYFGRGEQRLLVYLPEDEPAHSRVASALATKLMDLARNAPPGRRGMLVSEINGVGVADHPLAPYLVQAGFVPTAMGYQARVPQGAVDDRERLAGAPTAR